MDEADAVDLSKENIQPLRQGRNKSQLGLALQAQFDEQIHQLLLKMQEAYEVKLRTYEGSDPLEVWVEYISWVEQSFPKHGLEGNLEVLLQKCITALKDEERYKQDRRFVKLWLKFIEMQVGDRLEMYRFLSGQNIGTACTDFYLAWAYEFELLNDYKRADAVYQLACKNMAQPRDELQLAHLQFQLRVARIVLDEGASDAQNEENNRTAMASLIPVGPKQNQATTVRIGAAVSSSTPGIFQHTGGSQPRPKFSLLGPHNVGADRIQIYQEEGEDPLKVLGETSSRAASVPVHRSRNKENASEAGPWNKPGGARVKTAAHIIQPTLPAGPSFQVHRDEGAADPEEPIVKPYTPSVLKPRKLEEDPTKEALAIFQPADPTCKSMYPKDKVYAGGKEYQLEEVLAIEHLQEKREAALLAKECLDENRLPNNVTNNVTNNVLSTVLPDWCSSETKQTEHESQCTFSTEAKSAQAVTQHGQTSSTSMPCTSPPGLNACEVTPGGIGGSSVRNTSSASELSSEKNALPNPAYLSMYNQSITVHTKQAMNEVDDLWRSPNPIKYPPSPTSETHRPLPADNKFAFDICKDEPDIIRPVLATEPNFILPSRFKKNTPFDSERAAPAPAAHVETPAGLLRAVADGRNETLSRSLGPETGGTAANAPVAGGVQAPPHEPLSWPPKPALSSTTINPLVAATMRSSIPLFRNNSAHDRREQPSQIPAQEAIPIFGERVEGPKEAEKSDFQFNVFVDDLVTRRSAEALNVGAVTPGKLNTIAKEKENALKFSHEEVEEIVKMPKAPPARKSGLPQPPQAQSQAQPQSSQSTNMFPAKSNTLRTAMFPVSLEESSAEDTCTTKAFKGGFLVSSTPFTTSGLPRDRVPVPPFTSQSLDLNGSIFTTGLPEEAAATLGLPQPVVSRGSHLEEKQLSTMLEGPSQSDRAINIARAGNRASTHLSRR